MSDYLDQLERLSALRDKGAISDEEYERKKKELLEGGESTSQTSSESEQATNQQTQADQSNRQQSPGGEQQSADDDDLPEDVKKRLSIFHVGSIKNPEQYGGWTKGGHVFRRIVAVLVWPIGLFVGLIAPGRWKSKVNAKQANEIVVDSLVVGLITIIWVGASG